MPAAVAIPLIYGAAKVGEAVVQHRAAGKAMDTQNKGAQQALGANRQAYDTQQGLYQNMLGGANNTLARLSTPAAGAQFAAGGPPVGQFSAPGLMPGSYNGAPAPGQRPQSSLGGFAGILDRAGQMQGQAPRGPVAPQGLHNYGGGGESAGMPQAGGMVTMRAPDGRTGQVPQHLVSAATRDGYQPMGGGPAMPVGGMPASLATLGQVRM